MTTKPLNLDGWTVERAHKTLGQLAARELTLYDLSTRRHLRRAALATLATQPHNAVDPVAQVLDVATDRRGVRSVTCGCPWCGHLHVHGWPLEHERVGHRVSHCGPSLPGGGYYVTGEGTA